MTDDAMTDKDQEALAAAKEAAEKLWPHMSRWDNLPGSIVITEQDGKEVHIRV